MKNNIKKAIAILLKDDLQICITPKGARWGNLLYFFLHAFIKEKNGKNFKLLYTTHMAEVLKWFPDLKKFTITEKDVKFYHQKDASNNFYQIFGEDFGRDNLYDFIKTQLLTSSIKDLLQNIPEPENDWLTINIRRGDFYEKGNTSLYGYDQIGFVKHIFKTRFSEKNWQKITVISDDMIWCEENFFFLNRYSKILEFPEFKENTIISSFLRISKSQNLILSNSTFSFWAAYISNYLYGSAEKTYCPIFGSRRMENTDLYQFDPNWQMIKDFNFES
ncbi:alpha-1,2-fucosyltransferase [Halpernia frigidisoli]|uniref:Glycosyl transferase family 11 n=1 Tax=Halpernia frigidisoli TaxID=1125876 RepID=A0A1I3GLN3_9FLAO|nr:alpha-1,2-fucosyltransferase [Halpernia frigidisoli]SFI24340.1 Glycosyl transferase family 11 [Halpernia frigidisoli]